LPQILKTFTLLSSEKILFPSIAIFAIFSEQKPLKSNDHGKNINQTKQFSEQFRVSFG
jgi:hypothetical protein